MNIKCQIDMIFSCKFPYILWEVMTMEVSYGNHNSTYTSVLVALQPSFALGSLDVLSRGDNRIEFALAVLCKWSLIQKVSELSESLIYPCLTRVYRPTFIIFPWKSLQSGWKVYRKLTKQNLSTLANRRTGCFFNWYKAKQANSWLRTMV